MVDNLLELVRCVGFSDGAVIAGNQIVCDRVFRDICASNGCGVYGKCWMCPPDIGEIDTLIEEVKSYSFGVLYQSIFPLEDSFDFEGMQEAGRIHGERSRALDALLREEGYSNFLHLSKGGCGLCSPCAKVEGLPCRFPKEALSSLEAYGVNVSATIKNTSMKYINGVDTVTYFGMILFRD